MADPLAQFRKKPTARPPMVPPSGPDEPNDEYVAFGAKDKVARLKIRRANAPTRAPVYASLLDMSYDSDYGTGFVLAYSFLLVLVRGRNLQPVITGIENGMIDFIQEFDRTKWGEPADGAAPFIESIEIAVVEGAQGMSGFDKELVRH